MAKASSPVRLENTLMEAASVAASANHRSAAEQIEYWADLGRKVAKVVDPDKLLAVNAGLASLKVEDNDVAAVDPDAVFAALDRDRQSGALAEAVASGSVRYQAAVAHPGLLEQVHPDGRRLLGCFVGGVFQRQEGE